MALPVVVIVGRPNVGKSSLLNALAGQRISIVDPRAGITRDRVSALVQAGEHFLELVDTGGIGIVDDDHLEEHVGTQIEYAIARADVILFVVEALTGPTPLDQLVAARLRPLGKPVILVANKADAPMHEALTGELHALGFGTPLCTSALHGQGRAALFERIVGLLGAPAAAPETPVMKLAIVGKRNAGKSTLVNTLAGEERVIVSEIPGTTRDAVDVRFQRAGREFIAIDTAGVRKKARMTDVDFYSYTRALSSIQRSDVVLLLIDAEVPVAEVDLKLARAVLDEYKPVVFGINKWDLIGGRATPDDFATYLAETFPFLTYAPAVFLSGTTGYNVGAAVDVALGLHEQAQHRVPTAELNAVLQQILALRGPSAKHGTKPVRIYYGTQVAVAPPTIVFFCNAPGLVGENYRRFMENRLREMLPLREVPIRMWFRPRGRSSTNE